MHTRSIRLTVLHAAPIVVALITPVLAAADDTAQTAPPTPQDSLPQPQSAADPAPTVAAADVVLPDDGIVDHVGLLGGDTGYGRAGVRELGGSAGLMIAPGLRNVNVSPMVGWFFTDNIELSAIVGAAYIKAGSASATVFSTLVEPSYHVPFNRSTFGFLGMGFGMAYVTELGGGLAVAPRIGAKVMVGRSGVFTPSLSYEYTTHNVNPAGDGMEEDLALLAVSSALRINVGYTAMW